MKTTIAALGFVAFVGCGGDPGAGQADAAVPAVDAMGVSVDAAPVSVDMQTAEPVPNNLDCKSPSGLYSATYFGVLQCAPGPGNKEFVTFEGGAPPATFYGADCTVKTKASADNCTVDMEYSCPSKERGTYANTTYTERRVVKWSLLASVGSGTVVVGFVDATGRRLCNDSYRVDYLRQ